MVAESKWITTKVLTHHSTKINAFKQLKLQQVIQTCSTGQLFECEDYDTLTGHSTYARAQQKDSLSMLHTIFDWHRCQKRCLARSSGEAGHERKHIWPTLLSNKPILLNLQWVQRAQGHSPCDLLRHRSKRTRDVLSESQGMRTHFSVLYQQPAFQWNNSP